MRSPGRKGRSSSSAKPANMLASMSLAARPTASEPTPSETTSELTSMPKRRKTAIAATSSRKTLPSLEKSGPNSRAAPPSRAAADSVEYHVSRIPQARSSPSVSRPAPKTKKTASSRLVQRSGSGSPCRAP